MRKKATTTTEYREINKIERIKKKKNNIMVRIKLKISQIETKK